MTDAENEYQQMCAELDYLRQENERLRERLSWAIQLTDDHNDMWSERLNARIDAEIKAAGESE